MDIRCHEHHIFFQVSLVIACTRALYSSEKDLCGYIWFDMNIYHPQLFIFVIQFFEDYKLLCQMI